MSDAFEQLLTEAVEARRAPEPEATVEETEEQVEEVAEQPEPEGEEPEGDGEPDPDEADDEDAEDDSTEVDDQPLAVDDDTVLTLSDGTELTGKELREGYLRQADYTRKTQELAEQRREVESKLDDLAASIEDNPVQWVTEIVSGASDPTAALAQALVALNNAGKLDPEFVKTFGLEAPELTGKATQAQAEDRIARLEREREEERQAAEAKAARDAALAEYRSQWLEIVTDEGLTFGSPAEETAFKAELAAFAGQHQITDLRIAYAAMERQRERIAQREAQQKAKDEAAEQVARRKQQTSVMAQSQGGARPPKRPTSFDEAAAEAVQKLLKRR